MLGTTSTESNENDVDNSNANNGTGSPQTNAKDEKVTDTVY